MHRYLASMAVRVVCFLAGCFAPFPYNIALFAGAAIIPGIAVILANAIDKRASATAPALPAASTAAAITPGITVHGDIDEERAP